MTTPLGRLAARVSRRLSPVPAPVARPLTIVSEWAALRPVPDVLALEETRRGRPGVISRLSEPSHLPEADLRALLEGRVAGEDLPGWRDGTGGAPVSGVAVCRTRDVFHAPEFGAVILDDGRALESTVAEALYVSPTLGALPYAVAGEAGASFTPPADLPTLREATVFLPWGGRFNYGHFLIDGLTALEAATGGDPRAAPPAVAPPLNDWQRELLGAYLGPSARAVREVSAPLVRVGDLVFATPMNHFLHAPGPPLERVRARLLAAADPAPTGVKRLYLSRRGSTKREMVNEAELEAALEVRGFTIVHAERLSIRRQIALFRDAETVVAPTGAALANVLFCAPGTPVFEIVPSNFVGVWVRGLSHAVGAVWHGFFARSPIEETPVYLEAAHRPGMLFAWSTPIESFLAFLDARL